MAYQFKTEEERIAYENRRDTAMTRAEAYEEEYDWESFFTKIFTDDSKEKKEKDADIKKLKEKGFVEKDGYWLVRNDVMEEFVNGYNENKERRESGSSRHSTMSLLMPTGEYYTYDNTLEGYAKWQADCDLLRRPSGWR